MALQIKVELGEVHEDSASSLKAVYFWINESEHGPARTENEVCSGCPVEVIMLEIVKKSEVSL